MHHRFEIGSAAFYFLLELQVIKLRVPNLLEFISRKLRYNQSLFDAQFVVLSLRMEQVIIDVCGVTMDMMAGWDVFELQKLLVFPSRRSEETLKRKESRR